MATELESRPRPRTVAAKQSANGQEPLTLAEATRIATAKYGDGASGTTNHVSPGDAIWLRTVALYGEDATHQAWSELYEKKHDQVWPGALMNLAKKRAIDEHREASRSLGGDGLEDIAPTGTADDAKDAIAALIDESQRVMRLNSGASPGQMSAAIRELRALGNAEARAGEALAERRARLRAMPSAERVQCAVARFATVRDTWHALRAYVADAVAASRALRTLRRDITRPERSRYTLDLHHKLEAARWLRGVPIKARTLLRDACMAARHAPGPADALTELAKVIDLVLGQIHDRADRLWPGLAIARGRPGDVVNAALRKALREMGLTHNEIEQTRDSPDLAALLRDRTAAGPATPDARNIPRSKAGKAATLGETKKRAQYQAKKAREKAASAAQKVARTAAIAAADAARREHAARYPNCPVTLADGTVVNATADAAPQAGATDAGHVEAERVYSAWVAAGRPPPPG